MINKLFLDLNNFKPNLGSVERGDSIELNIKLLNDEDYSRSKFRLLGAKSDGKSVEQIEGLNLEEKDLKVVLEDQFVNCEGIVKLELNVVSGETEITTKEFYFFVSNTMNGEIVESSDSVPTLEKVSKYVDDAVNNLDALKEASADIALINGEFKENEIKRKANEMLREKNEKSRLQSEDIRITEEEEREANELERIQAENDRKVDESNRKLAENTRVTNERAREEAELSRQSTFEKNEEIRNSNENLRIASEKERIKFNNKAKTDEVNRNEAETKRVEAEIARVTAEDGRTKAETSRQEAEAIRQNTYTNFNDAEEERKNNEISRQDAEALRVEAESRRDNIFTQKEEERNAVFLESERTRDTAFNETQSDRNLTFEESERVREEAFKVSEAARNEAEEVRKETELLRVEAENNREVAESKRVKAESARVEAEKLRVAAEAERVEAENLRITAEEGRVEAETRREEGFNAFEGKINANTEELKGARSATTGEQFDSLDERIDCEVDRINKKIEVSMLQQEDKGSHVVENSVEGMTTDMIVKGRTLNNLYKVNNVKEDAGGKYILVDTFEEYAPKDRVVYIVNNTNKILLLNVYKIGGGWDSNPIIRENSISKLDLTGKRLTGFLGMYDRGWVNNESDKETLRNTCIVLDREETYMPQEYFEGIKSFGQQENKISILSSGLNRCTDESINGFININVNNAIQPDTTAISYIAKVYKGGTYYLSKTGGDRSVLGYFKSYPKIGDVALNVASGSITVPSHGYIVAYVSSNKNTNNPTNIIISENINANFQPYKEDKKDILIKEPVRKSDYLYEDNGQVKVNRESGQHTFTGNENIILDNSLNTDKTLFFYCPIENVSPKGVYHGYCNTIPFYQTNKRGEIYTNKSEGCFAGDGINKNIQFFIDKSKLTTPNVEGFKAWLKANPTTVVYQLDTPTVEVVDGVIDINLKTFGERTYVLFENSISGTSSFKAPVNTVATIARLNRENRALEEENKNLKQDFKSTTLTLIDSDLELVKQNVDMDFRLMEVEFALDIPQAILSSNINFKNKKGEVKSMARSPYEMMKIVILSGDYDREDYMYKVGKYYERGRMTKEEHDELISLMTADEVISK